MKKSMSSEIGKNNTYIDVVLKNVVESIMITDENQIIEFINHNSHSILSYDWDEYIGRKMSTFFNMNKDIDLFEEIDKKEFLIKDKYNNIKSILVTNKKIVVEGKNKFLFIIHDISNKNETQNLRENFISIISHELRTPLTSIRGSVGLLASGILGSLPEKACDLLKIASNNSIRLVNLINDMLDLEKIKAGKIDFLMSEQNVLQLVEDAMELNFEYAEQNKTSFELGKVLKSAYVNVDSDKFMQIMTNLLSNACKHSTPNEKIIIDITSKSSKILISIKNKGEKIPEDIGNHLFESFYQVKNSTNSQKKGSGLGLSIAKYLIEKMNGHIQYTSTDKDTTFMVELPEIYLISNKKRVLVCEDDHATAKMLAKKFEKLDYQIDLAYTAKSATKKLSLNQYDLMSLDLNLPDKNGVELLKEIRLNERTKILPVIIVSASSEDKNIIKKYDIVNWYEKTYDDSKLKQIIKNLHIERKEKNLNLLYVEDDDDLSTIVSCSIKDYVNVQTTKNIKDTQDIINKEQFDIILLDYKLKDGNIDEIIDEIKLKQKAFIIIFSAYNINEELQKKVDKVILKTQLSNTDFINQIKKYIEEKK